MLPDKIENLVRNLRKQTDEGQVKWSYDDAHDTVHVDDYKGKLDLAIQYTFDQFEDVGKFSMHCTDKDTGKEFVFSTDQRYNDYDVMKSLYDCAQSSDLDLDDLF